jgi:acylphosphatase
VRNCSDGTVEIIAQGERQHVQQLVTWCHNGPPGARVTRVEVDWQPAGEDLASFTMRY